MHMKFTHGVSMKKAWKLGWAVGLSVALGVAGAWTNPAWAQSKKEVPKADGKEPAKRVTLIMRDGKTITGTLISEDESSVKLAIEVAGIKGQGVYQKSDILEIKPLADAPAPEKPKEADKKVEDTKKPEAAANTGGPKVYVINMTGEFGRDVAFTPMEDVIADVKKFQPDILVCRFDHTFSFWGEEKLDVQQDNGAFDYNLEHARQIATLLRERIEQDKEWKTKPRLVGWVKKALGGAAFLPFVCPEIYYTSGGIHGGIGGLEFIFEGRGDERTREKQISLRRARAEGLAQQGGHDSRILVAMARTDYVLSVSFRDGTPKFIEGMPESPDDLLLTDDGKEKNGDVLEDIARGRGNDDLTLHADLAYRIGFSKGTADTLDDLMDRMGVSRSYQVVKGKSDEILREWSKNVNQAEEQVTKQLREYQQVQVRDPGGYRERTEARGRQKSILLRIKQSVGKYKEAINPRRIRGMPDDFINQIDERITVIDAQQRADDKDR